MKPLLWLASVVRRMLLNVTVCHRSSLNASAEGISECLNRRHRGKLASLVEALQRFQWNRSMKWQRHAVWNVKWHWGFAAHIIYISNGIDHARAAARLNREYGYMNIKIKINNHQYIHWNGSVWCMTAIVEVSWAYKSISLLLHLAHLHIIILSWRKTTRQ
jgi:hypothetical protein